MGLALCAEVTHCMKTRIFCILSWRHIVNKMALSAHIRTYFIYRSMHVCIALILYLFLWIFLSVIVILIITLVFVRYRVGRLRIWITFALACLVYWIVWDFLFLFYLDRMVDRFWVGYAAMVSIRKFCHMLRLLFGDGCADGSFLSVS